ncbi:hypoxanthine-guanine phosphoribosyltransferase-like [Clytia hemisphaerica]|uniref:Phosphoribosyltransferase domain-containing protein n=1 Tax=Clytia hemisphaerica TaxID=252671 RepID=A0A7M5X8L6_9CNID|eukprot:TCONS_00018749-protein
MMSKSNCIYIPDEHQRYDPDLFVIPKHYRDSIDYVLIPHGLLLDRIERLAQMIIEDYGGQSVTLLCVLKGGFRFCQDIMATVERLNTSAEKTVQMNIDFIRAKSYSNNQQGEIQLSTHGPALDLLNKNVLVVEDCIDSGRTMKLLLAKLSDEKPKSLKTICLVLKRNKKNTTGYRPDYLGFDIPDTWITGYGGFDYNEYFRDLNHVIVLNAHGRQKYDTSKTSQEG